MVKTRNFHIVLLICYAAEAQFTPNELVFNFDVYCNETQYPTIQHEFDENFNMKYIYDLVAKLSYSEGVQEEYVACEVMKLFENHKLFFQSKINRTKLKEICPALLSIIAKSAENFSILSPNQTKYNSELEKATSNAPSLLSVWGYGFLSVTVISACSLVGIGVLPLMNKKIYNEALLFLIALAVGTLSSNALFQLIPEGFGVYQSSTNIWRSAVIFAGCYLFFLTENILEILFSPQKLQKDVEEKSNNFKNTKICKNEESKLISNHRLVEETKYKEESQVALEIIIENSETERKQSRDRTRSKKKFWLCRNYKQIKAVAWMITVADGMHNFIDGLAIGASYSTSLSQGLSTSVAIFCEEFPHELGDFAILLSAGMSVKQAVFFNFASACTCYLGMIASLLLGHKEASASWIFLLAGGVFLYISLAGMLPEAEQQKKREDLKKSPWKCLVIENLGLLTGFAAIFTLTFYKNCFSIK